MLEREFEGSEAKELNDVGSVSHPEADEGGRGASSTLTCAILCARDRDASSECMVVDVDARCELAVANVLEREDDASAPALSVVSGFNLFGLR